MNFDLRSVHPSELFVVEQVKAFEEKSGDKRRVRINIRYKTEVQISPRTLAVAEAFGIGVGEPQEFVVYDDLELLIGEEDIVYITGDSGSGKSALLRAIENVLGTKAMNISSVAIEEKKPLIETVGKSVSKGLELLSRVGLNDAVLFVREYDELSDGQKYRYRLAKLMESEARFWIADEFCSTLDRDTAKIVAFNTQKIARQERRGLIIATCNQDLFKDLSPTVYVVKHFGQEVHVQYFSSNIPSECSLVKEMKIVKGAMEDYKRLAHFHYRSSYLVAPKRIFAMRRNDETVGVIVYARPPAICFGRKESFGRPLKVSEINAALLTITRVIVHPKYRTIGLGVKLVKETLPLAGSPHVEMVAVMSKYNPFAVKAGMKKVVEKTPDPKLLRLKDELKKLGFNQQLLGSIKYNEDTLRKLTRSQINNIKKGLIGCHHFFLLKTVLSEKEYSLKDVGEKQKWKICAKKIQRARIERLAQLISMVARLTQVKVYLIWNKNEEARE